MKLDRNEMPFLDHDLRDGVSSTLFHQFRRSKLLQESKHIPACYVCSHPSKGKRLIDKKKEFQR